MPIYAMRCDGCGQDAERYAPIATPKQSTGCECGATLRRRWTPPAVLTAFRSHWNASVGAFVTSRRDFEDRLKQGAEEMSQALGTDTRYVSMDAAEAPHSDEGLHEQQRAWRDSGWTESARTVIPMSDV